MMPATMNKIAETGKPSTHIVDDRGEVRREGVGPPVPDGGHHQHAEQDCARRPESRDVVRRELVCEADLGAQIADDSDQQDF